MTLKENKINLQVDICEIVNIFDDKLDAIRYCSESFDELNRILDLWDDTSYLYQFAKDNNISKVDNFVRKIQNQARILEDNLNELYLDPNQVDYYFQPLDNYETSTVKLLSKQKGKTSVLRLYAIKIENNYFLITGGAIKMSLLMDDHIDTRIEKQKLEIIRNKLIEEGVLDKDSYYEFKTL